MRARLLIASLVAALTIVTMAPAARADDGSDAFVDDDGDPTAVADDTVDDPGNPGGSDDDCTYRVAIEDDFEFGVYDVDGSRIYSETGRWLERVCDGSAQEPFPEGGAAHAWRVRAEWVRVYCLRHVRRGPLSQPVGALLPRRAGGHLRGGHFRQAAHGGRQGRARDDAQLKGRCTTSHRSLRHSHASAALCDSKQSMFHEGAMLTRALVSRRSHPGDVPRASALLCKQARPPIFAVSS